MKPSEMSNEELAGWLMSFAHEMFGGLNTPPVFDEIATRLSNSIPKPVVGIDGDHKTETLYLNNVAIIANTPTKDFAVHPRLQVVMGKLRTALGLEGGE